MAVNKMFWKLSGYSYEMLYECRQRASGIFNRFFGHSWHNMRIVTVINSYTRRKFNSQCLQETALCTDSHLENKLKGLAIIEPIISDEVYKSWRHAGFHLLARPAMSSGETVTGLGEPILFKSRVGQIIKHSRERENKYWLWGERHKQMVRDYQSGKHLQGFDPGKSINRSKISMLYTISLGIATFLELTAIMMLLSIQISAFPLMLFKGLLIFKLFEPYMLMSSRIFRKLQLFIGNLYWQSGKIITTGLQNLPVFYLIPVIKIANYRITMVAYESKPAQLKCYLDEN